MRVPSSHSRRGGSRADFHQSRPTIASKTSIPSEKGATSQDAKTATVAGDESLAVDLKGTIDEEKMAPPKIVDSRKARPLPKMSSKRQVHAKEQTRNDETSPAPRKSKVTSKDASPRRTRPVDKFSKMDLQQKKKLSSTLVNVDAEADA